MKKNVWFYVIVVYMVCYIFRMLEYFGIRTDQTIIGEAFIHKIIGIFIMVIAVKQLHYRFEDIGIKRKGIIRYTIYGLLSGVAAFAIGYGTEIIICMIQGNFTDLSFYVSSYAIDKNIALEQGGHFPADLYYRKCTKCYNGREYFSWSFPKTVYESLFLCSSRYH